MLPLPDKAAKTIVEKVKSICARHGILEFIQSDGMPFLSNEFVGFTNAWGIKTFTSSPEYSQSNGHAERSIQTQKKLIKKAHDDHRDPCLALLEFRNTPISGLLHFPAQLLMSRRLRAKIPGAQSLLEPRVVNTHRELCARQSRQKHDYDRGTKPLPALQRGDQVRYRKRRLWKTATVLVKDLSHIHTQFEMLMVRFAATAGNFTRLLLRPCLQEMTLCLTQAPRPPVLLFTLRLLHSMAAKKLNAFPLRR